MKKFLVKTFTLFVMAAILISQGIVPVAISAEMTDSQIDALFAAYLPEGVSLEDATDEQIHTVISDTVRNNPSSAEQIVKRAVERNPGKAAIIASAAASVLPDQASTITMAAINIVPEQAAAIRKAVDEMVYSQQQATAIRALEQTSRNAQQAGAAPPPKDDTPASRVK